jgi:hypothetical protein
MAAIDVINSTNRASAAILPKARASWLTLGDSQYG